MSTPDVAAAIDTVMSDCKSKIKLYPDGYWVAFEITDGKDKHQAFYAQKKSQAAKAIRKTAMAAIAKAAIAAFDGDKKAAEKHMKGVKAGSYLGGPYKVADGGITFHYPQSEGTLKNQASKNTFKTFVLPAAKGVPAVKGIKQVFFDPTAPEGAENEFQQMAAQKAERRKKLEQVAEAYKPIDAGLRDLLDTIRQASDDPELQETAGPVRDFLKAALPNAKAAMSGKDLSAMMKLAEALDKHIDTPQAKALQAFVDIEGLSEKLSELRDL